VTTDRSRCPPSPHVRGPGRQLIRLLAFSAFCRTVLVSSSIDEAVCSKEEACSSVRWLRSALPEAICVDAVAIVSAAWLICR